MFRDENPAVLRERKEQLLQELEVLRQEAEDLRNNRAAIPNNAPDAAALAAAAAAAPAAPAAVHRVAVKLPAFWPDRPSLWFAQADSHFILSDITLIERLSASEEQRVRQLISEEELGDRKPSQFLRHLRSLAGATIVQDNLMRQLWLHRLPSSVRAILATQTDAALDKLAELADKIIEISPCTPTLNVNAASTVPRTSTFEDTILKAITDLQRQALLDVWIARFGVPHIITTDRGGQFKSHIFAKFLRLFGIQHNCTTSWHPKSNGMIERLHRQLKSALIAHSNNDWVSCLPLVLLGIRSSFKEDIKSTIAELVYGESLRLPSEFFCSDSSTDRPGGHQEVLSDLRKYFSDLRPSPASRHGNPSTFVFKELKDCTHAYLKDCRFLKALQSPYTGPYEIINRDDKLITLKINNAPVKVSIDRIREVSGTDLVHNYYFSIICEITNS
uniref:Integrase catalytic domain-containing protein n=1 Tax=Trichogramma kaykai TaxID=54128 RepID=A0ABD2WXI7_9HYME